MKTFEMCKLENGFYMANLGRFGMVYGCTKEQAEYHIERAKKYQ